jgi:hypothetical protein
MSIAERLAALSPGRLAVATGVAAIGGMAGLFVGIAVGSVPLVVAAYAVIFGAGLLPAVADWCEANAAVEAIERRNKEQTAIDTPQRCVDRPALTEARAIIKAKYAHLMNEPYSGSVRFQERVSAENQAGRERAH